MVIWECLQRPSTPGIGVRASVLCMLDKNNNFQYICNQHHYEKLCPIIIMFFCSGIIHIM